MLGNMDEAVTAAKSQSATHLNTQSTRVTCRAGPLPWASEEVGVVAISLHSQGSLGMGAGVCMCEVFWKGDSGEVSFLRDQCMRNLHLKKVSPGVLLLLTLRA